MKSIFLKSVSAMALAVLFVSSAYGQQTNLHVSMPPLIAPYTDPDYTMQVSASYIRMHGERIISNGIDINTVYRTAISDNKVSHFTLGAALLGSLPGGEMVVDTVKRDLSGIVIHGNFDLEYLVMKRPASSLTLFAGIPFSLGDFIVEGEEDVTVYNIITGLRGGARLNIEMGHFTGSPLVMVNVMGGYIDRFTKSGSMDSLSSGGIPVFAVLTSGLEILYRPLSLTLSGIYQRTVESGDNKPIDTVLIQLGWSF